MRGIEGFGDEKVTALSVGDGCVLFVTDKNKVYFLHSEINPEKGQKKKTIWSCKWKLIDLHGGRSIKKRIEFANFFEISRFVVKFLYFRIDGWNSRLRTVNV